MGFSRQEYWSGLPFPSPGDLPDPEIEPRSPTLQADALTSEPPGKQVMKPASNDCSQFNVPALTSRRNSQEHHPSSLWDQLGAFLRLHGRFISPSAQNCLFCFPSQRVDPKSTLINFLLSHPPLLLSLFPKDNLTNMFEVMKVFPSFLF